MARSDIFKLTAMFFGTILLILFCRLELSMAQSLDEANRLNEQVIQLKKHGRYQEAIAIAKRALAILEKTYGKEHPEVVTRLNDLAGLYRVLGDYSNAEALYKQSLTIIEKVFGPEHPLVAFSLDDLAKVYSDKKDYSKAEALYKQALAILEKAYGKEHLQVANSLSNLALLYSHLLAELAEKGRYREAIDPATKILNINRQIFGEKHLDTATSYSALAFLYHSAIGDYAKAEPLYQKALAIQKEKLGEKHPDTALSYQYLGKLYQDMGSYSKAEPLFRKTLTINKGLYGEKHLRTVVSYSHLGALYYSIGDYGKAEPLLQKALAIRKNILGEKHPDTATSYNNLGLLYEAMGDYGKAEPLLQKALAIRKNILGEKHPDTATSYGSLGFLYEAMGDYGKAEPTLQKALTIIKEVLGEKHPDTATSYNNLGELYGSMGDYGKAELLLQKALSINREVLGEKHFHTAAGYSNLGVLYEAMGDYAKAEAMYQKALPIIRKVLGEKHPHTAAGYNNLGLLYEAIGDYAKAEAMYQKALMIHKEVLGEKHPDTAASYNNLGNLYQAMGDYAKAKAMLQKALAINKEVLGGKHLHTVGSYSNMGHLYVSMGNVDAALNIFKKIEDLFGLGFCYLVQENYKSALAQFEKSLSYTRRSGAKEFIIANHIGLGFSFEGLGKYGEARKHFEQAIETMEDQWVTLPFSARKTFLEGKAGGFSRLDAYEGLVSVIIKAKKKGYERESLLVAERVKSRTLLEMLAARGARGVGKEDQEILAKDRRLQKKIAGLVTRRDKLEEKGAKASRGRLEEAKKSLTRARNEYERFINEVKLKNVEVASLITTEKVDVAKTQKLLDPSTAILEYFTTKDKTYAWVITRDRIALNEMDMGHDKILAMVDGFLVPNISNKSRRPAPKMLLSTGGDLSKEASQSERNRNRERFLRVSQEAYDALFKPLEAQIGQKNLVVVPHGALHKTPFSALHNGNRFLVEKYALSVAPSLSVIPYVVNKRNKDEGRFLAFADPVTDSRSLAFAEIEVKSIEGIFPRKEVYARSQATETKLKERASSQDIVHFACHGEFNDKQPMQSGLLLSKDSENDGYLQVHEIFGLDLRNANLVCLSACETGLSKVYGGDDMVGLSRGFIYAGAPSLMATLWGVDDRPTSILMKAFYENWQKKGMSKPEALRQAQMALKAMRGYEHPFFWAGFIMIGDWMGSNYYRGKIQHPSKIKAKKKS